MSNRGAGGTSGGTGRFFLGFLMLCAGGYLFFRSIVVTSRFGLGYGLFHFGGYGITSGMVCVPLIFGVGIIFYNSRNILGWLLSVGSLAAIIAGVVSSINFSMRTMSAFDLITIFVLFFGGLGLFLSSLREYEKEEREERG